MSFFSMSKVVLKSLFQKPSTRNYPHDAAQPMAGSRGRIAIAAEQCIYCGLCAKKCPTAALSVKKPEKEWAIDRLRCIVCGYCVDVCPKKCLTMKTSYSPPTITKDKEIF